MPKFHPIPYHEAFGISVDGEVINFASSRKIAPNKGMIVLEQSEYSIVDLLALAFIGFSERSKAVLRCRPLCAKNVDYETTSFEHICDNDYLINGELYRTIPSCPSCIISESSIVWSITRKRFVHCTWNHAFYATVSIPDLLNCRNPKKVHRLVYETYIGELDPNLVVDHKDDRRYHNHWSNLQQITIKENTRKAFMSVNNPHNNIWTLDEIEMICYLLEQNMPTREIADYIGRDYDAIRVDFNHLIHRLINGVSYTDIAARYELSNYNSSLNKRDAVFTPKDVIAIRKALANGEPVTALARQYKCSTSAISKIRDFKTWKRVVTDDVS